MRRPLATSVAVALLVFTAVGPAAGQAGQRAPAPAMGEAAAAADAADPTGRWIVLYENGTDAAAATEQRSGRSGFRADRVFSHGLKGFAAALTDDQVAGLRADSAVSAVIPDEKIELAAQIYPTGIARTGARVSPAATIDGIDQRVDADVAILDTGIAKVADLNVVGGYDCSTSDRSRWRDVYGHGTHVAGTVGAIDNGSGVVGVAPGVRLWAVKVIDDTGSGLLSWYACGIDWVYSQRDPSDPSRPRIEAVNMSITKWGQDDGNCGGTNGDILHRAICRLVDDGVTVVVAAANDSGNASARVPGSYDEVITVSALADSDGRPGGLGGNRCFSWGTYDVDDTFADFSNYGEDVDLIAPGKCIYSTLPGGSFGYSSGTSMASPHVTGAAALVKATRPTLSPAEVKEALQYLGTLDWRVSTDPDGAHERLLDVSRLGPRGDFDVVVEGVPTVSTQGGTISFTVRLVRDSNSFERVVLNGAHLPAGVRPTFADRSLFGFEGLTTTMTVQVARGLAAGTYQLGVVGDEHGRTHEGIGTFKVSGPTVAPPPTSDAPPRGVVSDAPPPPRYDPTGSTEVVGSSGPRRMSATQPATVSTSPAADPGDPEAAPTAATPAPRTEAPRSRPDERRAAPATWVGTTAVSPALHPNRYHRRFLFVIAS